MANGMTQIIEKIQKLIRLKDSPNEHEAALAASRIQEMLDKYNLSMAEINTHEAEGEDKITDKEGVLGVKHEFFPYEIHFFSGLARQFDCFPYISHPIVYNEKTGRAARRKKLHVVGHARDIEVFTFTFEYLYRSIKQWMRRDLKVEAENYKAMGVTMSNRQKWLYKAGFGEGCSSRILGRLREQRETRMAKDQKCQALVLVRKDKVNAWVKSNMRMGRSRTRGRAVDGNGVRQGMKRGNEIPLTQGVGGGNKARGRIR